MSIWGHRVSVKVVAVAAVMLVVGALLTAMSRLPEREITLVARGMAFYLESDPRTPNPPLTVKAGERVRIVLRNDDRGITHDIAVPIADAAADQVDWSETSDVTFDVPDTPGRYQYICRPHMLMMQGTLVVE